MAGKWVPRGSFIGPTPNITATATATAPGSPATVTKSGTPEAPVLEFALPRGNDGKDGSNVLPTDDAIEQAVKNPASKTAAALSSTIASKTQHGPRTVFDGDSITIGGMGTTSGGDQDRGSSWTHVLSKLSMGRVRYIYNAAVAAQRSDHALARFDTHVAPYDPDTVILTIGTNDIAQGITQATWQANIQAYYDKAKAIGAKLIVGEIWPTDVTPERMQASRDWSAWLRGWAAPLGVHVIRWQDLADPVTGGWRTGWATTEDRIHPINPSPEATKIGMFGWESIKGLYGNPVVARPAMPDLSTASNPFFLNTDGSIAVPAGLAATPATGTGTLPAGTYAYRVAARTYFGEGIASPAVSATLTATGQISLSWQSTFGNRGYHLYRRGPLDSQFRRIASWDVSTLTYVDNGAAVPTWDAPLEVDASGQPTGMLQGIGGHYALGFGKRPTPTGIRGNVWRFTPMANGAASASGFEVGAVTPGDKLTVTCLVAGTGLAYVRIRWRSATPGNLAIERLSWDNLTDEWGLIHHTLTAPADAASARIYFEATAGSYIDVAEVLVRKN